MNGDRVRRRCPYLGLGDLPTLHRRDPCEDSHRPCAPRIYTRQNGSLQAAGEVGAAAAEIQVYHPAAAGGSAETCGCPLARPGTRGTQSAAYRVERVPGVCGPASAIMERTRCCMARPRWARGARMGWPRILPVHGCIAPRRKGTVPVPGTPPASRRHTTCCTGSAGRYHTARGSR